MKCNMPEPIRIIRDTREKTGWSFGMYLDEPIINSGLKTGDYSLAGYEDLICIERKKTSGEISNNLRGVNRTRFEAELKRMADFEAAYLICEFTIDTLMKFPEESGIPRRLWYRKNKYGKTVRNIKLNGKYILSFLQNMCNNNDIELIFCDGMLEAEATAYTLLKNFYENKTSKK